jgi:dihydrofolate reductase
MINIIVAMSINSVIGKDNIIPWHLPTDMKFFKETTTNHTVIMGRKCWESIPEKFRPLPNRKNIVVTRDTNYVANGAEISHDLTGLLEKGWSAEEEIFVIGGSEIYKEAFKYASKLYLTQIYGQVDGNILLEGLEPSDWKLVSSGNTLEENGHRFRFELYTRK